MKSKVIIIIIIVSSILYYLIECLFTLFGSKTGSGNFIVFLTFISIALYTWETYRMRLRMEAQSFLMKEQMELSRKAIELSIKPCLALNFGDEGNAMSSKYKSEGDILCLINVGNASAININIKNIIDTSPKIEFNNRSRVLQKKEKSADILVTFDRETPTKYAENCAIDNSAIAVCGGIAKECKKYITYKTEIIYEDISGRKYMQTLSVHITTTMSIHISPCSFELDLPIMIEADK